MLNSREIRSITISIHALLAESDLPDGILKGDGKHISIHALLAESDAYRVQLGSMVSEFLSTLSLRRATPETGAGSPNADISIHALLAESDTITADPIFPVRVFLSTLSLRRATFDRDQQNGDRPNFYPRSPCGERQNSSSFWCTCLNFYPRSPCGERHWYHINKNAAIGFLSTLSLRRATRHYLAGLCRTSDFYPRSPCGERPATLWRPSRRY